MFEFRLINTADGNQVIDRRLKTPYESLDLIQFMEYLETEESLDYMDRVEKKAKQKSEHMKKLAKNPLYRIACVLGLV